MSKLNVEQGCSRPRTPGTNKRQWTNEEESKLIEVLIEFCNEGKLKADKGFKPGQLNCIEERLNLKLPGCVIKAKPHIESKLRTFHKHFGAVHDMITGPNCSGFGWDCTTKCVTAENAVWDEYLKSHPDAEQFRYKPFLHYDELCMALGKDRATGSNAENPMDVAEELEKENDVVDDNDEISISGDGSFFQPFEGSKSKKRKMDSYDKLAIIMQNSATILGSELSKSTDKMCMTLENIEASDSEKRSGLYRMLKALPGLSSIQVQKAAIKIGCDRELIDIFLSVPDEEKESFVKLLIE